MAAENGHRSGIRVGGIHAESPNEERGCHPLATDDYLGVAKIHLGLTGRVRQRHKHLGLRPLPLGHRRSDDALASGVPMLLAKTVEDPTGRVPLLFRGLAVGFEDGVDDGQERPEPGPGSRDSETEPGRFIVFEDLLEGLPVNVVVAARRPLTHLAGQYPASNL